VAAFLCVDLLNVEALMSKSIRDRKRKLPILLHGRPSKMCLKREVY
jgi:hypothetical protein